jgi:ABC-2 type transport system ATP-binding protein
MTAHGKWWGTWAPFWDVLEVRHLSPVVTDELAAHVRGPCLVVGAGQGLIVEHLRERGVATFGLDLEREMIVRGRARRGFGGILGDASHLPFAAASFRAVVVSSGVVDYVADEAVVAAILGECRRVLADDGALLVAFYKLPEAVRRVGERLGVVDAAGYHLGRLFDIHATVQRSPLACVAKVAAWTGKGRARAFVEFTRVGLRRPRAMREDAARVDRVVALAAAAGVTRDELFGSVPDLVPHRDADAVRALLGRCCGPPKAIVERDDCVFCLLGKRGGTPPRGLLADGAPDAGTDVAVRAERLAKRFSGARRNAVDGIDLAVARGTIHGILGPNGAGKSTTIRMLLGLLPPDAGRIALALGGGGDARARIGYVPQDLALYPRLKGRENLVFFGGLYGLGGRALAARIDAALELVGLAERAGDPVGDYSTGMMRRLNLAAGLLHEPALLFLDEPTVGIDPQSRHRIYTVIEDLRRRGVTILLTTHYMDEARRLCDRLSIMDGGRIILEGPPAALLERFGTHRVEIAIAGARPGLADRALRATGAEDVALADGILALRIRGAEAAAQAIGVAVALAEAEGARAALKSVREPDLEALFLEATGSELAEGA